MLMSSLQQNWRRVQNRFCLEARGVGGEREGVGAGEEMAQTMYAPMNKWINIKKEIQIGSESHHHEIHFLFHYPQEPSAWYGNVRCSQLGHFKKSHKNVCTVLPSYLLMCACSIITFSGTKVLLCHWFHKTSMAQSCPFHWDSHILSTEWQVLWKLPVTRSYLFVDWLFQSSKHQGNLDTVQSLLFLFLVSLRPQVSGFLMNMQRHIFVLNQPIGLPIFPSNQFKRVEVRIINPTFLITFSET
jgi:hypothetical protein